MKGWLVFEFAAFLPLLLQVALLLFFRGLSEFLLGLNPIVGWVTTGAIITLLTVLIFTLIIAPLISSQCPYKTPISKGLLLGIRTLSFACLSVSVTDLHAHSIATATL